MELLLPRLYPGNDCAYHSDRFSLWTGGDGNRHYDPTEMLEFAWDSGLEDESPETLYMQFVEHQHQEGLRQEEQEQQEMLMMRRARMSECGVVKLPHPRIAAAVGGERSASIRSRLATEPIWVAEAAVGMLGRLREYSVCIFACRSACKWSCAPL